ncbi:hypothetical protein HDV57DRAFT_82076 [Trichoderma longibrachiatum]
MTEYRSLYCTAQFPVQLTWPYTPQSLRFLYMLRHTHSRCCEKQAMSASSRISYNVLLLQYSVHTGRPILCPSPVSQCGSTAAATYCGPAMTFKQKALTITVLAWMSGRTRKIPRASSVSTCDGGCSFHVLSCWHVYFNGHKRPLLGIRWPYLRDRAEQREDHEGAYGVPRMYV